MLFSDDSRNELEIVNPVPVIEPKRHHRFEQLPPHLENPEQVDTYRHSEYLKTMQNEIEEIIGPDQA